VTFEDVARSNWAGGGNLFEEDGKDKSEDSRDARGAALIKNRSPEREAGNLAL
jgi:hypothetical protein